MNKALTCFCVASRVRYLLVVRNICITVNSQCDIRDQQIVFYDVDVGVGLVFHNIEYPTITECQSNIKNYY